MCKKNEIPVDTGRKLNVHKTFLCLLWFVLFVAYFSYFGYAWVISIFYNGFNYWIVDVIWNRVAVTIFCRPYPFKFFKGCLPPNLLSPLLNTLSHIYWQSAWCPNTEFFLVLIFLYSDWVRTRKNSVFGFFLRSVPFFEL